MKLLNLATVKNALNCINVMLICTYTHTFELASGASRFIVSEPTLIFKFIRLLMPIFLTLQMT